MKPAKDYNVYFSMLPIFETTRSLPTEPFQTNEALCTLSSKITALSLTVHLLFRNVLSLCVAGSLVGCSAGLLVKKTMPLYHLVDPVCRALFRYERYLPLIKIACLVMACFLGIWSNIPAIVLSVGIGIWTGCTLEMKQACTRFTCINPFEQETI